MDKHTCKLCYRHFSNGRALGGHMRSHVTSAAAAAAAKLPVHVSSSSSPSASATSSSPEDDDAGKEAAGLGYGLRENPRKSFRLVDPEFSSTFAALDAGSSVVVQDRESETESSRCAAPPHRRRSKRPRRANPNPAPAPAQPFPYPPPPPDAAEPEPVSSVSSASPEEDVALCLMMLSRDIWSTAKEEEGNESDGYDAAEEEEEEDDDPTDAAGPARRAKYQCGTCKKVFRSYQALGGHRASHKKLRIGCAPAVVPPEAQILDAADSSEANAGGGGGGGGPKAHECPVCFRVFSSGQALGGHKRSHLSPSSAPHATITMIATSPALPPLLPTPGTSAATPKFSESLIDLNLPAPMDEDAEVSAVSDAEFVLHRLP